MFLGRLTWGLVSTSGGSIAPRQLFCRAARGRESAPVALEHREGEALLTNELLICNRERRHLASDHVEAMPVEQPLGRGELRLHHRRLHRRDLLVELPVPTE